MSVHSVVNDLKKNANIKYADLVSLKRKKSIVERVKITSSSDVGRLAMPLFDDSIDIHESMFLLLLNRANVVIWVAELSKGGISGTVVDVRMIAKYALDVLASGCIMVHNHPSGNNQPSKADKDITSKTKDALKLFDVALLDHVIVMPDGGCFSFADDGLLY